MFLVLDCTCSLTDGLKDPKDPLGIRTRPQEAGVSQLPGELAGVGDGGSVSLRGLLRTVLALLGMP